MDLLLKVLLVAAVVTTLWLSDRYRNMSRSLDRAALGAIRRMMGAAEESGYPPETVPLLILFTLLSFFASVAATGVFGR